ncbi:MAG: hypothetical protein NT013_29335 [Planctomycetia bacterium]|nr:hypothetical protein [Planctomycetia bacterium]
MKQTLDGNVTRAALVSNSPPGFSIVERAACRLPMPNEKIGEPFALRLVQAMVKLCGGVTCLIALCFLDSAIADDRLPKRNPLLLRIEDDRPRVDPSEFQSLGIRVHESKHLRLFTDVAVDVSKLPPLMDQAFDEFEKYFGPVLPAASGEIFQVNGYLIKNQETFKKVGLLGNQLDDQPHGRQKGYQFWMMDQPTDYYRRHLMLHEMTHTFMRSNPYVANPRTDAPLAYLEGMAEHFGTHRLAADGKLAELRVMPHNREDFRGHDRLYLIREDVKKRPAPNLFDVLQWEQPIFKVFHESYPWAWGVCLFLDQHPRTKERFQKLARSLTVPQVWTKFVQQLDADKAEISTEWTLFATEAYEGFDFNRMAIDFRDGQPLKDLIRAGKKSHRAEVRADRGWQSSGIVLEKGREYEFDATGRFTLAEIPKPWVSEADGITFRYHHGRPLGQLLAAIRSSDKADDDPESMLQISGLGTRSRLEAAFSGTLYLRLNDHPAELGDNKGSVSIEVRELD